MTDSSGAHVEMALRLDRVSSWANRSVLGSALDFSQTSAMFSPRLISPGVGGTPVVRFDGGDALASANSSHFSNTSDITSYVVFSRHDDTTNERMLFQAGNFATDEQFGMGLGGGSANGPQFRMYNGTGSGTSYKYVSSGMAANNDYVTLSSVHNNGFTMMWNGLTASGTNVNTPFLDTATITAPIHIGNSETGGNGFRGDIVEILVFKKSLGSTELAVVESYLARKYGNR